MAKDFRTDVEINGTLLTTGNVSIGSALTTPTASITSTASASIPVIFKAAASQSTAIFNILDSSNNVLFSFGTNSGISNAGANGGLFSAGTVTIGTTNAYGAKSSINTVSNGNIGLSIRAAGVAQTADLQQWQNSSGTALASVSKDGMLYGSTASIAGAATVVGNLTALAGTNTLGVTTFRRTSGDPGIYIDGASGTYRLIWFTSSTLGRWSVYASNESETGSNVGSNFIISRYTDAGSYIGDAIKIIRSTGAITLGGTLTAPSVTVSGILTASAATTTFGNTTFNTDGNGITISSTASSEGGQINFSGGTSYSGSTMQIDNYQGNMRILNNNGNSTAVTITNSTGLVTIGSGGLTASAGTTTLGTTNTGIITSTGSIQATIFHANSNGAGTNFRVGDDVWIGDINNADTMSIRGISGASSNAYIRFGSDTNNFGYDGSVLGYAGNTKLQGQNQLGAGGTSGTPAVASSLMTDMPAAGGTANVNANYVVNADGKYRYSIRLISSSLKQKNLIGPYEISINDFMQIQPRLFSWKEDSENRPRGGFILEEVSTIPALEPFINLAPNGENQSIDYGGMVALLTDVVQKQQNLINDLNDRITALETLNP